MLPQLDQLLQIMTTITKHKTPMTVATNRTPPPRLTASCHVTMKVKDCSEFYLFGEDEGLGLVGAALEWNEVVKVEKGNQNFYDQLIPPSPWVSK